MTFEDWYKIYPKKTGMGAARQAYSGAVFFRGATHDELLDGVKAYAELVKDEDPRFIPKPSNWLNDECWKDEAVQRKIEFLKRAGAIVGWQRAFYDELGAPVFEGFIRQADFAEGVLIVAKTWQAEHLRNHLMHKLRVLGVREVSVR